jgi:hypothetical protein
LKIDDGKYMRDSDIADVVCGVEEIVLDGLILGSEFQ